MIEEWRPIPNYPGYEASNLGNVRSLDRMRWAGSAIGYYFKKGQVLKPSLSQYGYPEVRLHPLGNPKGVTRMNHLLVALTFLGERPEGQEVRHLDGDRKNPVWKTLSMVHVRKI